MLNAGLSLDSSIEAMRREYPQFSVAGLAIGTGPTAVWKGYIQPLPTEADLVYLLDDLAHDRPVEVSEGGRVTHFNGCHAQHCEHEWMEDLTDVRWTFKLEMKYAGGREHPRAYVIQPALPASVWKHSFKDGQICPYAPWERVWSWRIHTVVDFLDHVTIWLVKSIVSLQAHTWIGSERDHSALYLLTHIMPTEPCWCGSDRQYGECHRARNEMSAMLGEVTVLQELERRNPHGVAMRERVRQEIRPNRSLRTRLRAA